MCFGSAPQAPSAPPPVAATPIRRQPKLASEGVRKARQDTQNQAKQAAALGGTLLTGAGGLTTTANTSKKTLLGQ